MKKIYFLFLLAFVMSAQGIYAQTWTLLSSGTSLNLYAAWATSVDTCYVTGDNGIIKSTNQGASWSTQTVGEPAFRSLYFINSNTGFLAGGTANPSPISYIYKTISAGTSWTLQHSSSPNGLYSVRFLNSSTGYSVGGAPGSGLIFKTTNGGTSWTPQTSSVAQWLFDVAVIDGNTALCVGYNGCIQKTTNGGTTWASVSSSTSNILHSICFPSALTGYIAGENGTILKSINGGNSWTTQNIGSSENFWSVYFLNDLNGFIVGTNGTIIHTTDGGATWTPQSSGSTSTLINVFFLNQNLGYVCGGNGTIIKYTNDIGIDEVENNFNVSIYPNPTNDIVNIEIPNVNEPVNINIFDLEGKLIYSLHNVRDKNTVLNLKDFSSGEYIMELKNSKIQKVIKLNIL